MCEFISWKEVETDKGKEILFLTAYDIFSTKRGRQLQKHTTPDDFVGHGAIAFFYEIDPAKGINRECTDFSDPKYFPDEIVAAVKAGKFRGLGNPEGLLTAPAWKAYQEATATAWKAYQEATAPAEKAYQEAKAPAEKAYQEAKAAAWKAYQEATAAAWKAYQEATAPVWKAYQEATATAWKAYQEAKAPAWKAYQEATAPAWKAYQEAKATAFWDLFADQKNRNPKWR